MNFAIALAFVVAVTAFLTFVELKRVRGVIVLAILVLPILCGEFIPAVRGAVRYFGIFTLSVWCLVRLMRIRRERR